MSAFTDFFWPTLDNWGTSELAELRESNLDDADAIRDASWDSKHTQIVLDEARRLFDSEEARRNSADAKASTYLVVCAGLIPLMIYVVTTIIDVAEKEVSVKGISDLARHVNDGWVALSLALLCLSVAYLIQAGRWSLRAMSLRAFHQVDSADILKCLAPALDAPPQLARAILLAGRLNRDPINDKQSAIIMAHEFLKRATVLDAVG
jgi:hypothetical protein